MDSFAAPAADWISLDRSIYPFGLASVAIVGHGTRRIISSGAGGPFTMRSEAATYVAATTIAGSGWPIPERDVGIFRDPGRDGGESVKSTCLISNT